MKVSAEKVASSQIELTIEVEPERTEQFLQKAYRRVVQRVNIPGFRKGKAPRSVVERHLGYDALLGQAIEMMVPEVCEEALKEQGLEALDIQHVDVLEQDPVSFKAKVATRPTVALGDYLSLSVERPVVEIDESKIEERLEELRHRYALLEPADRPAQWNDTVRADVSGSVEGRVVFNEEDVQVRLQEGRALWVPGVAEKIAGMTKGQEAEFTVQIPSDFSSGFAGKECQCKAKIHEVKEEHLPELNDGFARDVGEGFAGLAALKERLREDVRLEAEHESEHKYEDAVVEKLIEMAQVEYPAVLVEQEIDYLMRDRSSPRFRGDVESYLRESKKSASDLRQELSPQAEQRVIRSLVLMQVAEQEGIAVTPDEIDAEIGGMTSGSGEQAAQLRQLFASDSARDAIRRSLLTRKIIERLTAIASGNPDSGKVEQSSILLASVEPIEEAVEKT